MSSNRVNVIDHLPDDAWSYILSFLKVKHIIHRVNLVNKHLHSLITCNGFSTNQLWKHVCQHQRVTLVIPGYNTSEYPEASLSVLPGMGIPKFTLDRSSSDSSVDERWQQALVDKQYFIDYMRAISPMVEDLRIVCQTPYLALKVETVCENEMEMFDFGWKPFEFSDSEELIEKNEKLNKKLNTLQFPQLSNLYWRFCDAFELHSIFFKDGNCSQYRQLPLVDPRFINLESLNINGKNSEYLTTTLLNNQNTLKHFAMIPFAYKNNKKKVLDILSSCPKLETMSLGNMNCIYTPPCFISLKSLNLRATYNSIIALLSVEFPQLTRLCIHVDCSTDRNSDAAGIKPLRSLEYFKFSDSGVGANVHLLFEAINQDLKELVVRDYTYDRSLSDVIARGINHLTNIEQATLRLFWKCEELEVFLKQNVNMHTLTLNRYSPAIPKLVQLTSQLKNLNLDYDVTPDDFKLLLSSLPFLKQLKVTTKMSFATVSSILAEHTATSVRNFEVRSRAASIIQSSWSYPTGSIHQLPALDKLLLEVACETVNDWILLILASHQVKSIKIRLYDRWDGNVSNVTSVLPLSDIIRRVKTALVQTIPSDALLIPREEQKELLQIYQHLFTDEVTLTRNVINFPGVRSLLRAYKTSKQPQ